MSNRRRLRAPDRLNSRSQTIAISESTAVDDPPVEEAAAPAVTRTAVTISEASTGTVTSAGGHRKKARLIEGDRWGSSGYYPRTVIERDGPKVFPAGTHMYLDHPTDTEEAERPERSVRDLAATIATTPAYEGDGLYAYIDIFPHALPLIESIGEAIGLSIRGAGTADFGTIKGRTGPIFESLTSGASVDFVTRAGAGGKLISLAEHARSNPTISEAIKRTLGAYLEAQLHLAFTQMADDMYGHGRLSREERISLSSAIGEGLAAFTAKVEAEQPQLFERDIWDGPADDTDTAATTESDRPAREATSNEVQCALNAALVAAYGDDGDNTQWIYVCDYDPDASTVWYAVSDNQSRTTWQQQYELNTTSGAATSASLADDRIEVVARTTYVPVPPDEQAADDTDGDNDTDAAVSESAAPIPPAANQPPLSVADGAPPTVSTHPIGEAEMADSPAGNPPVPAGTTDTTVPAAVTEAQTARRAAEVALDEANRQRLAAETELARFRAVEAARPIANALLAESQVNTATSQARVMAQVTAAVPLTEAGVLDETAFRAAVAEAITDKETELAEARQGAGAGTVSGLGAGTATTAVDNTATTQSMTESFKRLGLSDKAAALAAGGRS